MGSTRVPARDSGHVLEKLAVARTQGGIAGGTVEGLTDALAAVRAALEFAWNAQGLLTPNATDESGRGFMLGPFRCSKVENSPVGVGTPSTTQRLLKWDWEAERS